MRKHVRTCNFCRGAITRCQLTPRSTILISKSSTFPYRYQFTWWRSCAIRKLQNDEQSAKILIESLIFNRDFAEIVIATLSPGHNNLEAYFIFPYTPELMCFNKIGTFSMAQITESQYSSAITKYLRLKEHKSFASFQYIHHVQTTAYYAKSAEVST